MQKNLLIVSVLIYTLPMETPALLAESVEALAALAIAEDNWGKMVDETVAVSGKFQEECKKDLD